MRPSAWRPAPAMPTGWQSALEDVRAPYTDRIRTVYGPVARIRGPYPVRGPVLAHTPIRGPYGQHIRGPYCEQAAECSTGARMGPRIRAPVHRAYRGQAGSEKVSPAIK